MTATIANGADGVRALVGQQLGPTGWERIDQERVDTFAQASGDHQWIHVDPERASRESPFGGPIAHGYLTLSLISLFLPRVLDIRGFSMEINYGCERVRFPTPVLIGSRVRASAVIDDVVDVRGGIQLAITVTIAVEGKTKPACVATVLLRHAI